MSRAPLIGISSYGREGDPPAFSMPCGYVDGVRGAGGVPLILPPGQREPGQLLDVIDGLVIAGGGDIAPAAYGGRLHPDLYCVSEERDQFELALTRAALRGRRVPVLFICRGMQILNTVCGGTLHRHIPEKFGEKVVHRRPPRLPTRHSVRVQPDSRLAGILHACQVEVCSWHHQAVDRLGEGLRPLAWANDGVIEAVEHVAHPWSIGVQWHPEMQLDEQPHRRLFESLVAAANEHREG